jgi:DNA-directed RNA polymerase III subunit RPC1
MCQGVPTIRRAVINVKDKDDAKGKKGDKELLVEGYGLQKVMTTEGSSANRTISSPY